MPEKRPNRPARRATPAEFPVASVRLWDHEVGAVAEGPRGSIVFEYDAAFAATGLPISPIHLPLSLRGPVSFPELNALQSFAGLPGLLADCLPDAFGNAVIRRYFEQRGTPTAALSPVQKLLYIGRRAMGALEFSPPLEGRSNTATEEAITVARLVEEARRVIEGDPAGAVPEIMQLGASAGGAHAKALILWNRKLGKVKSAFAPRARDDEHWLIKFDGVTTGAGGHVAGKDFSPGPYGRIEYAYSRMAGTAGVVMSDTHLLEERDFAHFMTLRFDRQGDRRLHMHSLSGLLHADYNARQAVSYEEYFRTIRLLGMQQPDVDQAYRRMVLNIAARNQDDHVKNLAFLMGPDGRWQLAPAFDMTWSFGGQWAMTHQMTANGKDDDFTREDLLRVGRNFDVARDGADILAEVEAALATWKSEAESAGLDREWRDRIESHFRHFR